MKSHTHVVFDVVAVAFVVHQVFVVMLILGWTCLQAGLKPWSCDRLLLTSRVSFFRKNKKKKMVCL